MSNRRLCLIVLAAVPTVLTFDTRREGMPE
jgi:hypothetical protein